MAWKVELDPATERDLDRLDPQVTRRILGFLNERVVRLDNPRSIGSALQGPKFGEFWKYRVGDWRLICKIEDEYLRVLVLRIRHRNTAYRS
ncbi:putative toxin [Syntrophobacter sp. SbD2]|nr:putative toxin [Syntrophobacter sp. SbD2]